MSVVIFGKAAFALVGVFFEPFGVPCGHIWLIQTTKDLVEGI